MKKSLKQDMYDYEKEGDFYKALKRKYKIYELNDNHKQMAKLTEYFNSEVGKKYKIMNILKSIKSLIDNGYTDKLTKDKIRLNLKELGLPFSNVNYDNIIKKLYDDINDETKEKFNF